MNYGRIAYLRQEELERRLDEKVRTSPAKRSIFFNCSQAADKRLKLFRVACSCFILNLSLSGGQQGANVSLFADDRLISSLPYNDSLTFTVATDESEECTLFLSCDSGMSVIKAQILVLDGFLEEGSAVAMAARDGRAALASCAGGRLRLWIFGLNSQPAESFLLGFGGAVDVAACVYDGHPCFCAACVDHCGNAYLVFVGHNGGRYEVYGEEFLARGVDTISTSYAEGVLFAAFVRGKAGHIRAVFNGDCVDIEAESIYLLKECIPPIAIVGFGGVSRLRLARGELYLYREIKG